MGVPHGWTIAQLLFIIFVSNISHSCTKSKKIVIYTDDMSQVVAEHKLSLVVEYTNSAVEEFAS